jgi:hypothetical protein
MHDVMDDEGEWEFFTKPFTDYRLLSTFYADGSSSGEGKGRRWKRCEGPVAGCAGTD